MCVFLIPIIYFNRHAESSETPDFSNPTGKIQLQIYSSTSIDLHYKSTLNIL